MRNPNSSFRVRRVAANAFFSSNFDKALVITMDGGGREESSKEVPVGKPTFNTIWYGIDNKIYNYKEAKLSIKDALTESIRSQMIADVPLGAFLSGGIDSTVVVGLMNKLMGQRVKTFSIGFKGDPSFDETAFARLVATRFNTDHTEFIVSPSAIDLMDTLIWHHNGPFGDS